MTPRLLSHIQPNTLRLATCLASSAPRGLTAGSRKTRDGASLMKPLTAAIMAALIVAVVVLGYLYYQRTNNDITIRMPKIEIKP
jgi:hypothetical protein